MVVKVVLMMVQRGMLASHLCEQPAAIMQLGAEQHDGPTLGQLHPHHPRFQLILIRKMTMKA